MIDLRAIRGGLAAVLCFAAAGAAAGHAAESGVVATERTEARIVTDGAAVPGGTVRAGLHLKHAPNWHSYWVNPGDSGLPTTIDWQLPEGWSAGDIAWPAPHRIPAGPFVNYGYGDDILLPVPIRVPQGAEPGSTVTVQAEATWLVCADVCIPEEGRFTFEIPVSASPVPDETWAPSFAKAESTAPKPSPWPATVGGGADTLLLRVAAPGLQAGRLIDIHFFAADPDAVEHAGAQPVAIDAEGFTLSIPRGIAKGRDIGPLDGVLVIEESLGEGPVRQAFDVRASVDDVTRPVGAAVLGQSAGTGDGSGGGLGAGSGMAGVGLGQALLLALAGGLLLNLMPCVFPVLFIKALGLAHLGAGERRAVRLHGLAYTGGVLATFGLLAGALVALQQSGAIVGWGFQLQHPAVILLLAYLMALIGLNLAGVFHIGGGENMGAALAARPGHTGAFFTGALAVIVATPCTAPFMGVALGFAVTQPPPLAVGIFLALGLGMALPFLLLSLFPGIARFLPRPGAWMEKFKQFLAFPMFATAAWLVWVLAQQAGPNGVIAALGGIILIAFGVWAWNVAPRGTGRLVGRAAGIAAFALALLLARFPEQTQAQAGASPGARGGAVAWQTFDPARIPDLRAEGKGVLVNLTAAWCITCQVNERVALSSAEVGTALDRASVVALKGDWTNGDPVITRYLAEFGRNGVPLYVLYPADRSGAPVVLPQLLTEAIVMEAIAGLPATTKRGSGT